MRKSIALLVVAACSSNPSGSGPDAAGGDDVDASMGDGPPSPVGPRLFPGPGQAGFDLALADKARAYDRQFHVFSAQPFGLSLDAWIPNTEDRALVGGFSRAGRDG